MAEAKEMSLELRRKKGSGNASGVEGKEKVWLCFKGEHRPGERKGGERHRHVRERKREH